MVRECKLVIDCPVSTPPDMQSRIAGDTIAAVVEAVRGTLKIVEIDYAVERPVIAWKALIDFE